MSLLERLHSAEAVEWRHPELFAKRFELTADGAVVMTLRFEKVFGSLATAEWDGGAYTLKRGGFLSPKVTIREAGGTLDLALLEMTFSGTGRLHLDGETFVLKPRGFLGSRWGLVTALNEDVFLLQHRGMSGYEAVVNVTELGLGQARLGMLLAMSWYTVVLTQDDTSTAVIAAVSG
jgi:hypothetical protein